MKYLKFSLFILLVFSADPIAFAAELQPVYDGQHLGIFLTGVSWPTTLSKDFQSGFENEILIRVSLISDNKTLVQSDALITEKYDLWNEVFMLKLYVDQKERASKSIKKVEDAIADLVMLNSTDLFVSNLLKQDQLLSLRADILVNPVDRERIEHVIQWVAENSTPSVIGRQGGSIPLRAKPNSLFNSIYEQYAHGAEIVAPWKISVTSKPFLLRDLQNRFHSDE